MKQLIFLGILLLSGRCLAQKEDMMTAFKEKKMDKVIEIGQKLLATEPNSFETNLMLVKAYNAKLDHKKALIYINQANPLATADWQKIWILVEAIPTYYGLGQQQNAKLIYEKAKQLKGTKNSESELNYWGILFGFDALYKEWKIVESNNLIFHFQNTIPEEKIKYIVSSRQKAFEQINAFFHSALPKKIDFFVWDQQGEVNPYLKKPLGFTRPEFCLSHNKPNQTPGHEIAHNISHWSQAQSIKTRFINEGIGVCFDQIDSARLQRAQESYKTQPVSIREMWQVDNQRKEGLWYTIAGAFVEFLIQTDKEKFLKLVENQTYENAKVIYGAHLDELIDTFSKKLNSQ